MAEDGGAAGAAGGFADLRLAACLIKPVQRLTKYPLLLRELLERLPDQHPYRAKLTAALEA